MTFPAEPIAREGRPTGMDTSTTPHAHDPARTGWLLALLLALALLLGACSASGGSDDLARQDSEVGAAGQAAPADGAGDDAGDDAAAADEAGAADPDAAVLEAAVPGADVTEGSAPLMVRRVDLELVVDDVTAAVSRARAAAVAADGWVSSEEVRPGRDDEPGWATLVLRVPSKDLDSVVTGLGDLGEVTSSTSSAEDVTTEYRDVEARVATLEAGAERLRDLVAEAGSVESIANLERELAEREADLDALKARMKVLADDVSRSTVTLHLAEDAGTLAETTPDTGFLAGLRQGWEAFTASVTLLLTALGGVLPFAVVAGLVAVPVLVWRRRARQGRPGGAREHGQAVPEGTAD